MRNISPHPTQYANQLLVQAMVIYWVIYYFNYSNNPQVGLPLFTVKPFQVVQNAEVHLVFDQPKRPHHSTAH